MKTSVKTAIVTRSLVFCVMFVDCCLSFLSWPLYCLSSHGHCIVFPLMAIVLSFLSWPLYCLSSHGHCIVFPLMAIVLSFLSWPLYCLSSHGHCIVFPLMAIVLSFLWFLLTLLISSHSSCYYGLQIQDHNIFYFFFKLEVHFSQ